MLTNVNIITVTTTNTTITAAIAATTAITAITTTTTNTTTTTTTTIATAINTNTIIPLFIAMLVAVLFPDEMLPPSYSSVADVMVLWATVEVVEPSSSPSLSASCCVAL